MKDSKSEKDRWSKHLLSSLMLRGVWVNWRPNRQREGRRQRLQTAGSSASAAQFVRQTRPEKQYLCTFHKA